MPYVTTYAVCDSTYLYSVILYKLLLGWLTVNHGLL